MATTASIVIEVDDSGATKSFQRVTAEGTKMGAALRQSGEVGNVVMADFRKSNERSIDTVRLLNESIGIGIPRALQKVIAHSALAQAALASAFSGAVVIAFAKIAIDQVVNAIEKIIDFLHRNENEIAGRMWGLDSANRERFHAALKQQRELATQTQMATANDAEKINIKLAADLEEIDKQRESAQLTGGTRAAIELEKVITARKQLAAAEQLALSRKNAIEIVTEEDKVAIARARGVEQIRAEMKAQLDRIEMEKKAGLNVQVAQARSDAIRAEGARKELDLNERIREQEDREQFDAEAHLLQQEAATSNGRLQIEREYLVKLHEILVKETTDTLALKKEGIDREVKLDSFRLDARLEMEKRLRDMQRRNAEDTLRMQEDAAIATLPPWQRAYAQIAADARRKLKEIQDAFDKTEISADDAWRRSTAVAQQAFAQMRDQLAGDLESLFNDITSGNIGKRFKDMFKHLVFQMVATWILGMQQMRGASQQTMGGGGGGILGAIFGGIFGGGGGGGGSSGGQAGGIGSIPGVILNFGGGSDTGLGSTGGLFGSLGLGLSGGQGATAGGVLPAGAGPGGGGPLGNVLGTLFSHGIGSASGSVLAMLGVSLLGMSFRKGGVLGALGGAAGGALTGFAIGGPIGALIGGIAGFFLGIFGHSTRKARLKIEADVKAQAQKIEDAYKLFQTDWSSSRDALEQLRQQGVDALRQAGVKDISRSRVGHVDHWIDKAEQEIDALQAERNRRGAIAFGPAQFRLGGFVGGSGGSAPAWFAGTAMHFQGGGAVPAMLHPGEYVLRPEAVSRIGVGSLNRMNSGGGDAIEVHMHFPSVYDANGFEETLKRNPKAIVRVLARLRNEGML